MDRLCKQCHELSSLQQRPSEASFKPSSVHRRKSTPSKAESLPGRQDLGSKGSALSSSQETSQQGSKSIASENDVVKTADSFEKGHNYVVETAGSFISEDSSRSKGGRGESSEQSLPPEPVRRSKRGRPYKPVGGLHPNKRRSVEHTSRNCDKGALGRSRASTDEEDELGMKIEKFRGLKDLSSGKDVKDPKLVLPEDQKILVIERSSLSLEPQSELAVKLETQVAGKYEDSLPHKSPLKSVEKNFEAESKNSEENDTAAENCVRRTGKITPVGRIVERSATGAEAAMDSLKTDNLGDSLSVVEISESLPATYSVTLKSENCCESVAGAISLDQADCPQVARFESRDARIEPLDLTRSDTAGEDSGESSRYLPVDVLELADTKSDQSKLVKDAVCGDRDDIAMETQSKPCIQDKSDGSLVVGQGVSNSDDRVFSKGHPGGATEARNMTTMLASVDRLDLKGQGVDHVLPFASKSMNNNVAGGVQVDEILVGVPDGSKSLSTEELTQFRQVVKSAVEECQMPQNVLSAAPLPELVKEGTPSVNCDATAEGGNPLGEGKSSKAPQSRDVTSSFVVSQFPDDLNAISNPSIASSGNCCVEGLSGEASSGAAGSRTLDDLHQTSSSIKSTSSMPRVTLPSRGLVNRGVDHQLPQSSPTLHAEGHTSGAVSPVEVVDATTTLQGGSSTAKSLSLGDITVATPPNNRISSESLERKSQMRGRGPPSDGKTFDPCEGQLALTDEEALNAISAPVPEVVEAYAGVAITNEAPKALSPPASRQSPLVDGKSTMDNVNHVSTAKVPHRIPTADSMVNVSKDTEFVKETFSSLNTPPTSNQTRLKVDIPGTLRTSSAEEEDVSIKESANSSSVEEVEDVSRIFRCVVFITSTYILIVAN